MIHVWASRRLSAYSDDELTAGARAAVARHLARCPACTGALAELGRVREVLRAAPHTEPPAEGWERLRERMAVPREGVPAPGPAVRRRAPAWSVAGAAAGLAVAATAFYIYLFAPPRPLPSPRVPASFVTTADLVGEEMHVPISPSLELLLAASHDGGAGPGEQR
jgi:anti-sigma factor RsiW